MISLFFMILLLKNHIKKKWIGKKLQQKCIEETTKMDYKNLYLITEHENYYEKIGWEFLENAPLGDGHYEKIYKYKLTN